MFSGICLCECVCCADFENFSLKMSEEAKHLPTDVESQITGFDSSKLKHTECHEKTSLPTADGIDLLFCVYGIHSFKNRKMLALGSCTL